MSLVVTLFCLSILLSGCASGETTTRFTTSTSSTGTTQGSYGSHTLYERSGLVEWNPREDMPSQAMTELERMLDTYSLMLLVPAGSPSLPLPPQLTAVVHTFSTPSSGEYGAELLISVPGSEYRPVLILVTGNYYPVAAPLHSQETTVVRGFSAERFDNTSLGSEYGEQPDIGLVWQEGSQWFRLDIFTDEVEEETAVNWVDEWQNIQD